MTQLAILLHTIPAGTRSSSSMLAHYFWGRGGELLLWLAWAQDFIFVWFQVVLRIHESPLLVVILASSVSFASPRSGLVYSLFSSRNSAVQDTQHLEFEHGFKKDTVWLGKGRRCDAVTNLSLQCLAGLRHRCQRCHSNPHRYTSWFHHFHLKFPVKPLTEPGRARSCRGKRSSWELDALSIGGGSMSKTLGTGRWICGPFDYTTTFDSFSALF